MFFNVFREFSQMLKFAAFLLFGDSKKWGLRLDPILSFQKGVKSWPLNQGLKSDSTKAGQLMQQEKQHRPDQFLQNIPWRTRAVNLRDIQIA